MHVLQDKRWVRNTEHTLPFAWTCKVRVQLSRWGLLRMHNHTDPASALPVENLMAWPFFFFFFMDDPGIRRTRCLFWESEFLCRALFLGHQQDFKVAQCNRHLFPYLCANELVFKVHTFIISHIELGILWLAVCFRLSPWVFHKIFVHLVKMASQIGNTSHFIWYTPRSPLCILWTES